MNDVIIAALACKAPVTLTQLRALHPLPAQRLLVRGALPLPGSAYRRLIIEAREGRSVGAVGGRSSRSVPRLVAAAADCPCVKEEGAEGFPSGRERAAPGLAWRVGNVACLLACLLAQPCQ